MSFVSAAAMHPATPQIAQSMMSRGVGFGMPMSFGSDAGQAQQAQQALAQLPPEARQHAMALAGQMRNHAQQAQAAGAPPQQAMQSAIQRFAPNPQGQAGAFGPPQGFANPLNGMFGPAQAAMMGGMNQAGRMPPTGPFPGAMGVQQGPMGMPYMNTRPGPVGFNNSLNSMFGPAQQAMAGLAVPPRPVQATPAVPMQPVAPTTPGRIPF
jgi:hypothetical protein